LSLGKKTINGSLLLLFGKVIQKSLGIISMLVLARFLTPEDFGIVAMATITAFFFDVIGETGTPQYIAQKDTITSEDVNTAWTLNLIFKAACFVCFILAIPLISAYSENELIEPVLYCISLVIPLGALISPGLIVQSRNLNYKPITKLSIIEKLVSICVTIPLAILLESYWAMVIGMIASYALKFFISYLVAPWSVRLCFQNIKAQWKFSKWVLGQGIIGFSRSEADSFLTTRLFGIDILGGFNLMKNISTLPANEIIRPIVNPLLPAFSRLKNEPERLAYQFTNCLVIIMLMSSVIVGYIYFFHDILIRLAFDEKWWGFSPLLGTLSLIIVTFSISEVVVRLLLSKGLTKVSFVFSTITLAVLLLALLGVEYSSIVDFAKARVAIAYLSCLVLLGYAYYLLKTSGLFFIVSSSIISLCAFIAGIITRELIDAVSLNIVLEFFGSGILYVVIYIALLLLVLVALWKIPSVQQRVLYLISLFQQLIKKEKVSHD